MTPETAVLISIRPKWAELIARGVKTLEVRKSRPAIEPPFTCYIYCTHGRYEGVKDIPTLELVKKWRGRIIGEFVCDGISYYRPGSGFSKDRMIFSLRMCSCLTVNDVWKYSDNGSKDLYGWHISGLHIYKKPLILSVLSNLDSELIRRAPQSWQYVERKDGT